ncbi:MAG TPA: hypothetical protein PLK31_01595 [Chloroflexota bacterium]|nr:hypothetical protein [Chloroflexota bacterium]
MLPTRPLPATRQTTEYLLPPWSVTAVDDALNLCELLPGQAGGLTRDACRRQFSVFDLAAEPERPFVRTVRTGWRLTAVFATPWRRWPSGITGR